MTDESPEVALQYRRHTNAVSGGGLLQIVQDIVSFAADARLPSFYADNQEEDLWYEMLEKEGLPERVGEIADVWVEASQKTMRLRCRNPLTAPKQNQANVQRAEAHVQRQTTITGPPMIKKFGFCRFKATPATESWYYLEDGPGVDDTKQTVVFIALEDLGPHNGFPFPLARGQDVCMDGNVGLWTPPTGGGLAIFFSLNL